MQVETEASGVADNHELIPPTPTNADDVRGGEAPQTSAKDGELARVSGALQQAMRERDVRRIRELTLQRNALMKGCAVVALTKKGLGGGRRHCNDA